LAGDVYYQWSLDDYDVPGPYVDPCVDGVHLEALNPARVIRGGSFEYGAGYLLAPTIGFYLPSMRFSDWGFRCARSP
jgi:formylglycine-generating enzyme required for sulfatase activity